MKTMTFMHAIPKQSAGFSLIEVLVTLVVLSIGLLGLAQLQMRGMQFNSDAYFRTQATILAYDIIDRMRANPNAAGDGGYHLPNTAAVNNKRATYDACKGAGGACNCDTTSCSAADLTTYDIGKWYEAQSRFLPTPANPSTIESVGNRHTITLRWTERELSMSQNWVVEVWAPPK